MNTSTARDLGNAIAAGFWITKDHGKWSVGRGKGVEIVILSTGHQNKPSARAAMIEAHKRNKDWK